MIALLRAEWVKLFSTRGFYASAVLLLGVATGYAALLGAWKSAPPEPGMEGMPVYVDNWMAIGGIVGGQGLPGVGLAVFMVLGALSVSGEYRTGLIQLTFAATPARWRVLLAKALVTGFAAATLALLLAVVSEYTLKYVMSANDSLLGFGGDLRPLYVVPMMVFLATVFAVGIGALLRSSAAAVSLILVWVSGVENLTLFAGSDTGATIRKMLPFANEQNAVTNGVGALSWSSPWLSVVVFAAWTAVFVSLGVVAVHRRDA